MNLHVSYSEISSFNSGCKWRWKIEYLDKHRTPNFSIHFDFGTAMHKALEKYLTRIDPCSTQQAIEFFKKYLTDVESENRTKYNKQDYKLDELLRSGENIFTRFGECEELKDVQVVHNEFALLEPIDRDDDLEIKFKGFIDIVIMTKDKRGNTILYVCDFKTCQWGWSREQRDDRWKQYQLFLYKHFLCKKFDIDPKQVRTAFVLLKKRPPKNSQPVEFLPVSAGPVSVQRAIDALGSTITEMYETSKTGNFEKDRKLCIDKYGNTCPHYRSALCPE